MALSALAPVLGLLANALVFGLSWWPFREMQALGLHPLWATALMYGLSFAFISLLRPQWFLSLRLHPQLWWLFLGSGLTNFGFNWAVAQGDVVCCCFTPCRPGRYCLPGGCWAKNRMDKPCCGWRWRWPVWHLS